MRAWFFFVSTILILSVLFRVTISLHSVGSHHKDNIFQYVPAGTHVPLRVPCVFCVFSNLPVFLAFLRSFFSVSVNFGVSCDCVLSICLSSTRFAKGLWIVCRATADFDSTATASAHSCPFNVDPLRASPRRVVLRRGGHVFENNEGSAESYSLSSQVDHIGTFVSHTWRTPRIRKFMALSFHFGFSLAYMFSCLIGVVVSTLGALRVLFFVELESIQVLERVPNGPMACASAPCSFGWS